MYSENSTFCFCIKAFECDKLAIHPKFIDGYESASEKSTDSVEYVDNGTSSTSAESDKIATKSKKNLNLTFYLSDVMVAVIFSCVVATFAGLVIFARMQAKPNTMEFQKIDKVLRSNLVFNGAFLS